MLLGAQPVWRPASWTTILEGKASLRAQLYRARNKGVVEGLDAYKAKFLPESWEPIYAITSEPRIGLRTLYAIAGAFGEMAPPELLLRALLRGVAKELEWLRRRLFNWEKAAHLRT